MDNKYKRYDELIKSFDEGCDLCTQYDSMPHQYGGEILYQSEMHFLQMPAYIILMGRILCCLGWMYCLSIADRDLADH